MHSLLARSSSLLCAALVAACAAPGPAGPFVVASLEPTTGNTTRGTVWFVQEGTELSVVGRVSGLRPNQEHGFHVHEKGDCSSGDGMSAGGHFNPDGMPHGPQAAPHHAGDLPSLTADAAGNAVVRMRMTGNVRSAGAGDIAAKALIVHAMPDDYVTQPTGNSGARLACAVIGTAPGRDGTGREVALP